MKSTKQVLIDALTLLALGWTSGEPVSEKGSPWDVRYSVRAEGYDGPCYCATGAVAVACGLAPNALDLPLNALEALRLLAPSAVPGWEQSEVQAWNDRLPENQSGKARVLARFQAVIAQLP